MQARLSSLGRRFIQAREGLRLTAYSDGGGYSIGYGHHGAYKGQTITRAEAEALFDADVRKYEQAVAQGLTHATQAQFDALVSFAYNVGTEGFSGSTVRSLHNGFEHQAAADFLRQWNKSQGEVHPELIARRELERTLYLGGGYGPLSPGSAFEARSPSSALLVAASVAFLAYWALPRVPVARRLLAG